MEDNSNEKKECESKQGAESCGEDAKFCPVTMAKTAFDLNAILKALIQAKDILLSPKEELQKIREAELSFIEIYKTYVVPLATIGFICQFIGMTLFGVSALGVGIVKWSPVKGIIFAFISLVLHLASLFIVAKVVEKFTADKASNNDLNACFAYLAYSNTPMYASLILSIIPALGLLSILFIVYTIYMLYVSSTVILEVDESKKIVLIIVTIVVFIVVALLLGLLTIPFTPVDFDLSSIKIGAGTGDL